MKRYTTDFQESVRLAVLQEGLTLAQASEKHGLSLTTLRMWRKRDEAQGNPWSNTLSPTPMPLKKDRAALSATLLEDYLLLHMEAVEAMKNSTEDPFKRVEAISRLSQALDRTLTALDKTSPDIARLNIAKHYLERQIQFVEACFPHHLAAFLEVLEPFGTHLAEHMASR